MLPLLSHWSLFDSLKHSTAIASRSTNLGVVETMVLELLAVIGVPLIEVSHCCFVSSAFYLLASSDPYIARQCLELLPLKGKTKMALYVS